jgi:hypothetical protein
LKKDLEGYYRQLNPPKQNAHDKDKAANINDTLKKKATLLHKNITKNTQAGKSKLNKSLPSPSIKIQNF